MTGLLAFSLAALTLSAWATASGHYKYGIWTPSVVYSQGGSSTRLEVYVKRGVKEVNFDLGGRHYVLRDDGLQGDNAAGDNVFTVEGVVFSDVTRSPDWICTFGVNLNMVLNDGTTEQAWAPSLGVVDKRAETGYQAQVVRSNMWVTDYAVFIQDTGGAIFPGFPVTELWCGRTNFEVFRQLYEIFPDVFDMVTIMPAKTQVDPSNFGENIPYSVFIKNDVRNIGRPLSDNTAKFISKGRLRLMTYHSFDVPQILDHEVAHAWAANLGESLGLAAQNHWTAWTSLRGQLTSYPCFDVVRQNPDGTYQIRVFDKEEPSKGYNDLELYAMGLIPQSEIKPVYVLKRHPPANPKAVPASDFTIYTGDQIVRASGGPRSPSSDKAPHEFTMAYVVVSNQPFSPAEIDFFSQSAWWFGSQDSYLYAGLTFYQACGRGPGTMVTKLPLDKAKMPLKATATGSRPDTPPSNTPTVSSNDRGSSGGAGQSPSDKKASEQAGRPSSNNVDLVVLGSGTQTSGSTGIVYKTEMVGGRESKRAYYLPGAKVQCRVTIKNKGTGAADDYYIATTTPELNWQPQYTKVPIPAGVEKMFVDFKLAVPGDTKPGEYKVMMKIGHAKEANAADNDFAIIVRVSY